MNTPLPPPITGVVVGHELHTLSTDTLSLIRLQLGALDEGNGGLFVDSYAAVHLGQERTEVLHTSPVARCPPASGAATLTRSSVEGGAGCV